MPLPIEMQEAATGALDGIGAQDHSITAEYRIFGPPGTGKTTNLTRQIRRAVERFGPPRDAVIRTFYVGMTRVRQVLYIAEKASAMAASINA